MAFRRATNTQAAPADRTTYAAASAVLGPTALALWFAGHPGAALKLGSHAALCLILALLATWRQPAYVQKREALTTLVTLHLQWAWAGAAAEIPGALLSRHSSHPLALFAYLMHLNAVPCLLLYTFSARLVGRWNKWALPLLALRPLLKGRHTCGLLLAAPGAAPALRQLHSWLDLLNSAVAWPQAMGAVAGSGAASSHVNMQMCLEINIWAAAFISVALPLALLGLRERLARLQFGAALRDWAAATGSSSALAALRAMGEPGAAAGSRQGEPAEEAAGAGAAWRGMDSRNGCTMRLYLASATAWYGGKALLLLREVAQ